MVDEDTKYTEDEPQTFSEVWNNATPESWKWQEAIWKDFSE